VAYATTAEATTFCVRCTGGIVWYSAPPQARVVLRESRLPDRDSRAGNARCLAALEVKSTISCRYPGIERVSLQV